MHEEFDIGALILEKLKEKERTVVWLAKHIGCDESNLRKTLKNSRFIYCDLLFLISVVLGEDFFAYYSQQLSEDLKGERRHNTGYQ